jgi:predicted nucleic acid-binding protein
MKRIYLDTYVWCRPLDEPSHRVTEEAGAFFKILQDVDEKRYMIIGSIILDDEIHEIKDEKMRAAVTELMTRAVSDRIDLISESRQKEIKKATGVKDEDAFHLTAAIEGKTEYFITVDDTILTKADKIERYGIKVRNPVDLKLEEAENGYGS